MTKLLTFVFSFVFVFSSCQSQDIAPKDVPAALVNTLKTAYPDATDLEWEKKGEHYEAEFDIGTTDYKALLDASGKLLQVKQEITEAELPAAVKQTISQDYKDYRIDDPAILKIGGTNYYQVELERMGPDQHLVFSADGKVQADVAYWD